jgi:hypothetical protein
LPKNRKYWKRRFGDKTAGDSAAYHHHLDFRLIDDLDDEGLAYIMTNVKGVDMLDLNETEISNESIKLLTGLEYIKELRAKECGSLDNDCIESLNQIPTLEFLHLKSTAITIDGLLQLTSLPNLKVLMFSAADTESIKEKMVQLKNQLPNCDFTVNSKPWIFDDTS